MRYDLELLEELDAFRHHLPYPVSRIALIEMAIRQMLDRDAKKLPSKPRAKG